MFRSTIALLATAVTLLALSGSSQAQYGSYCTAAIKGVTIDGAVVLNENGRISDVNVGTKTYGSTLTLSVLVDGDYADTVSNYFDVMGGAAQSFYYDSNSSLVSTFSTSPSFTLEQYLIKEDSADGPWKEYIGDGLVVVSTVITMRPPFSWRDRDAFIELDYSWWCRDEFSWTSETPINETVNTFNGTATASKSYRVFRVYFYVPYFPFAVVMSTSKKITGALTPNSDFQYWYSISDTIDSTAKKGTASFCGATNFYILDADGAYDPYAEDMYVYNVYQKSGDKVTILPPSNQIDGDEFKWMVEENNAHNDVVGKFSVAFLDVNARKPRTLTAEICADCNGPPSPLCFNLTQELVPPFYTADLVSATNTSEKIPETSMVYNSDSIEVAYDFVSSPYILRGPTHTVTITAQYSGPGSPLPLWLWDLEWVDDYSGVFQIVSEFSEIEVGTCESDSSGKVITDYEPISTFSVRVGPTTASDVGFHTATLHFYTSADPPFNSVYVTVTAEVYACHDGKAPDPNTFLCECPASAVYDNVTDTCSCVDSVFAEATGRTPPRCICDGELLIATGSDRCECPTGFERYGVNNTACRCLAGTAEQPQPPNRPRRCVRETPIGDVCSWRCGGAFCDDDDRVCCRTDCSGPCRTCDWQGVTGNCTFYPVGVDPNDECPTIGCDGSGHCLFGCTRTEECDLGYSCEDGICVDVDKYYSSKLVVELDVDVGEFFSRDFRAGLYDYTIYIDRVNVNGEFSDQHIVVEGVTVNDDGYLEVMFVFEGEFFEDVQNLQRSAEAIPAGSMIGPYETASQPQVADAVVNAGTTTSDNSDKNNERGSIADAIPAFILFCIFICCCVPAMYKFVRHAEAEAAEKSQDMELLKSHSTSD